MQWHLPLIGCPQAWQSIRENHGQDCAMGSPDITIAVVDWGIDVSNPDFSGNISNGKSKIYTVFDFQEMVPDHTRRAHGHGTCCAGVATAVAGNDGVCGVAGNCRLMAIRRPEGKRGRLRGHVFVDRWIRSYVRNENRCGIWHDVEGIVFNAPGHGGPHYSRWYGFGRIDAAAAMTRALDNKAAIKDTSLRSTEEHGQHPLSRSNADLSVTRESD
jgi:hypothetical protein